MQNLNGSSQSLIPIDLVGSSIFGRDPKIQSSRTFNMIVADQWLVDYFGYQKVANISEQGSGRGIFSSVKANKIILVINNSVYTVGVYGTSLNTKKTYTINLVGTINSFTGDVFIDENIANEIAICDQKNIYIYNYFNETFIEAVLPEGFVPGYVCYQDGYFISPDSSSSQWALSEQNNGLNWFWGASGEQVSASIQTKSNYAKATVRVPGRGNLLFVMGNFVTELWTDVGNALFPYQKSYSINMDYGCVNASTIASLDQIVAWLGSNEKSGPVIMFSTGGDIQQISTDGINYRFSQLVSPELSAAFFVKLSGHLIYQLTFYDPRDNYTVLYDFTEKKFFDATDENMNYHIARRVAFFNGDYYFISFKDGNLYEIIEQNPVFDYGTFLNGSPKIYQIPRTRLCSNIRTPNQDRFVVNNLTFTLEQGSDTTNDLNNTNYFPGIDMSISKNGGISFSNYSSRKPIYPVGKRINRLNWWNLGLTNDFVAQFRFFGNGPWRCTNGQVSIFQ